MLKKTHPKKHTPARQLGRVSHADWLRIKRAAAKSGKTFTRWAVELLLDAAKK